MRSVGRFVQVPRNAMNVNDMRSTATERHPGQFGYSWVSGIRR